MKRTKVALLSIVAMLFAGTAMAVAAGKVTICHVPPGNPAEAHTITVGEPGSVAHLRQHSGDYLGSCDEEQNQPPEADAGLDQCVLFGEEVVLDGSGSEDPDGDEITFAWSIVERPDGSTVELTGADTDAPAFAPDGTGVYEVELVVSDGELEDSDTVEITVYQDPILDAEAYTTTLAGADEIVVRIGEPVPNDTEIFIAFDDEDAAYASDEMYGEPVESVIIPAGETEVSFWVTGLVEGEAGFTVSTGTEACGGSLSAVLEIGPFELETVADALEMEIEDLQEQLAALFEASADDDADSQGDEDATSGDDDDASSTDLELPWFFGSDLWTSIEDVFGELSSIISDGLESLYGDA